MLFTETAATNGLAAPFRSRLTNARSSFVNGYIVDSGVLIGLLKHPHIGLRHELEQIRRKGIRLVTIREVFNECRTVPLTLVQELDLQVEPAIRPAGTPDQMRALDAFQGGASLSRADR